MKQDKVKKMKEAQKNLIKMAVNFLTIEFSKGVFRDLSKPMAREIINGLEMVRKEMEIELKEDLQS